MCGQNEALQYVETGPTVARDILMLNVSMYYVTPFCPHKSLTLAARDNSVTPPPLILLPS